MKEQPHILYIRLGTAFALALLLHFGFVHLDFDWLKKEDKSAQLIIKMDNLPPSAKKKDPPPKKKPEKKKPEKKKPEKKKPEKKKPEKKKPEKKKPEKKKPEKKKPEKKIKKLPKIRQAKYDKKAKPKVTTPPEKKVAKKKILRRPEKKKAKKEPEKKKKKKPTPEELERKRELERLAKIVKELKKEKERERRQRKLAQKIAEEKERELKRQRERERKRREARQKARKKREAERQKARLAKKKSQPKIRSVKDYTRYVQSQINRTNIKGVYLPQLDIDGAPSQSTIDFFGFQPVVIDRRDFSKREVNWVMEVDLRNLSFKKITNPGYRKKFHSLYLNTSGKYLSEKGQIFSKVSEKTGVASRHLVMLLFMPHKIGRLFDWKCYQTIRRAGYETEDVKKINAQFKKVKDIWILAIDSLVLKTGEIVPIEDFELKLIAQG